MELVQGGDGGQGLGALALGVQRVAGVHIAGQLGQTVLSAGHLENISVKKHFPEKKERY